MEAWSIAANVSFLSYREMITEFVCSFVLSGFSLSYCSVRTLAEESAPVKLQGTGKPEHVIRDPRFLLFR